MSLDFEWRGRLETTYHCQADFAWNSETFERWTKHLESRSAVASYSLQKQSRRIYKKSEGFHSKLQKEGMRGQAMILSGLLHNEINEYRRIEKIDVEVLYLSL